MSNCYESNPYESKEVRHHGSVARRLGIFSLILVSPILTVPAIQLGVTYAETHDAGRSFDAGGTMFIEILTDTSDAIANKVSDIENSEGMSTK